jgi:hypothetical protein
MGGFHKQRLIVLVLCIVGAISVFLPWLKPAGRSAISGIATAGFQSWGALLALVGSGAIVFTQGDKSEPLKGVMKYLAIGLCGIAALFGIYKVLDIIGFGLILLQVCSIGALFAAIYFAEDKKKEEEPRQPVV